MLRVPLSTPEEEEKPGVPIPHKEAAFKGRARRRDDHQTRFAVEDVC